MANTKNKLPESTRSNRAPGKFGSSRGDSFASRFNRERLFDVDTSNFQYYNLADLADVIGDDGKPQVWPVTGLYKNTKSNFGIHFSVATDSCYINLPPHMNEVCENILSDRKAVNDINAGKVGIVIYEYNHARFGKQYSANWVDVDPEEPDSDDNSAFIG